MSENLPKVASSMIFGSEWGKNKSKTFIAPMTTPAKTTSATIALHLVAMRLRYSVTEDSRVPYCFTMLPAYLISVLVDL